MACLRLKVSHETKISSWLPPVESWDSGGTGLPYGWESAVDNDGKTYYVNHVNKTTTYEDPRKDVDEEPPQPREVELTRDPQMGFGFVAGSEKPVIVRFVTEGGPNEHKLMPGDQILKINGEDVVKAPREHVIELVRSCKQSVTLLVCQPQSNNTTRKSALLTAAKKARLKNNPSRVRFAEGVVMNGSPLYSPSPLDSYIPFLPNVLKVFLENGQTKSFKYDSTTTVQDVLMSLQEKLSIKCADHFSLVTEHVKIARRNRMCILDPKDTLAKIASRPGSHHLRCVYRVTFVPKDAYDLLQKDPIAFEYLYVQCCNDMVQERFAPELKYDIALRLAALHIQQHSLNSGIQGKITIKAIERESGLDRFVPLSLLETMKRKELRKLLGHFLKQNQSLCAPGQKQLTALQAKLHYLKIISELPSYGAKCFSTNLKDSNPETALLVSPKFGVSQITCLRSTIPITLAHIAEIASVHVSKEDELSFAVEVFLKNPDKKSLNFSMEDRDAEEFVLLLRGYYRLMIGRELPVQWEADDPWKAETVPSFHSRHTVREAPWSYPPHPTGPGRPGLRTLDLTIPPPPYMPCQQQARPMTNSPSKERLAQTPTSPVDHNMNETQFLTSKNGNPDIGFGVDEPSLHGIPSLRIIDERHPGIDYKSVISMELLEDSSGDVDVDLFEARNDEVIKRISEMNQIVVSAETYLCEDDRPGLRTRTASDESDTPEHHVHRLKAADSLLLLTQADDDTPVPQGKPQVILDEEISPSESDTDSTPNDSPLHRSTPVRNSLNSHPRVRRDSSFGLHSPDLLPGLSSSDNNIIEILKSLQSEEMQLPFAEGTLYLDPDIIDLTMIPPPITPDKDTTEATTPLNAPPTDFLDSNTLHKELEKWIEVSKQMIEEPDRTDETPVSTFVTDIYKEREIQTKTSQGAECHSIDSAKVVADLDHLCDTLSEMKAINTSTISFNLSKEITLRGLTKRESIDSFIANLSVPPPPSSENQALQYGIQNADDLSAYIIPPPPSSSPSTEAQNEVIARFMAAAEDMRKMFSNTAEPQNAAMLQYAEDLTPTTEKGFDDIRHMWPQVSAEQQMQATSNFQQTLSLFDKFAFDSDFQSGDSSGYDTLTSSLTSYGETILSEDIDSNTFNCVNEEIHQFNSIHSSADSTPTYEYAPTALPVNNISYTNNVSPVQPHTRTSCVDATSPLSVTSPSSTTSSDSSVILMDGSNLDVSSKLKKSTLLNGDHWQNPCINPTGSCDNLPFDREDESPIHNLGISRSISWTSMTEVESPLTIRKMSEPSNIVAPKPPIPPNPFQQTRLRKSFRRGSIKGPIVPKKPETINSIDTNSDGHRIHPPSTGLRGSRSPSPSRKFLPEQPINGITPTLLPKELYEEKAKLDGGTNNFNVDKLEKGSTLSNGCVQNFIMPDGKTTIATSGPEQGLPQKVLNAVSKDGIYISHCGGPFLQAQKDISTMVLHLKKLGQLSIKPRSGEMIDSSKFNAAKEALVNESRQFVTSSKLFVKSAMESSEKMIENMAVCVALLNRMFAVSELVIMHVSSREQISFLIEKLKEVALAYLRTVDAAHKAVGTEISNPQMGVLMHQATTLATTLTSLMRTLRVISST